MILDDAQKFASPEEAYNELYHHGIKGMKWGVRKEEPLGNLGARTTSLSRTDAEKKAARRAMAKKAAIGAGVLTAVAGTAFVAYQLNKSGHLPISSIRQANRASPKKAARAAKAIQEQRDVIMLTRGKHTAGTFLKKGDTPNFFTHWENAFVKEVGDGDTASVFQKLASGDIAAAFRDPGERYDFSGRPISHQVIIPKSMTSGVESLDDVVTKIWPKLKDTYDQFYTESEKSPYK